jgi:hypothetical protein
MRTRTFWLLALSSVLDGALSAAPLRGATHVESRPQIAACRIGFEGHFKVGFWTPIGVAVSGDVAGRPLRVRATTVDSDGVEVSIIARVATGGKPVDGLWPVLLQAKVGRIDAAVRISLLADDNSVLDQCELSPNEGRDEGHPIRPMSATSELILQLGASAIGLEEAYQKPGDGIGGVDRVCVRLLDVDRLPVEWFGYEAVDVLVLTSADVQVMHRLAGDSLRLAALQKWLELGGRLVIAGGGAQELLAEGGPLAAFAPGRFGEVVRLSETAPLEHFAKSEVPLAAGGTRATMMVPQFADVEGNIEVYAGQRASDLPLLVRTARGLGEVTFVGVDLAASPLKEWPGRKPFLQAVLQPYLAPRDDREAAQSLVARGYNDLSGALRQRMGRSFVGVAPMTFSVVTLLAIAYLLVLGPVDYLIVHRWLQRPGAAWITFPLVVLVFGLAALALGDWRRAGGGVRVNRLELVDIDTVAGQARGTVWATLYSPRAEQFDVALDVESPGNRATPRVNVLVSWWGLPGMGIGGMQSVGTDLDIVGAGYQYGSRSRKPEPLPIGRLSDLSVTGNGLESLVDVPVLTSSTKSLLARWTAPAARLIDAQFADEEGLVEGFIENHSGAPLRNVRLHYNGWAYRLGNLDPGRRIDVGDEFSPRRVKTVVTQDAVGPAPPGQEEGTVFVAERATAEQILNLMMFYEAGGGFGFAQLANDYQPYCDLSRLLELGRAILVADAPTRGSRLADAETGAAVGDAEDKGVVVYRFVLPVSKDASPL